MRKPLPPGTSGQGCQVPTGLGGDCRQAPSGLLPPTAAGSRPPLLSKPGNWAGTAALRIERGVGGDS